MRHLGFARYSDLFGWAKTEAMDMGPGGTYQMFGRTSDRSMGGIFQKPAEMPVRRPGVFRHRHDGVEPRLGIQDVKDLRGRKAPVVYVSVDNVDSRVDTVKQLGGQVLNGPMDVPGGDRVAQCMDPQGAAFALHSSAASAG